MRYAITDLSAEDATYRFDARQARRLRWAADLRRWAEQGVRFIQLREKKLDAGELLELAAFGAGLLAELTDGIRPKLLVNGRPDIAAAAGAAGVHLTARPGELRPTQAREVFRAAGLPSCVVSVSCHTLDDVTAARDNGADVILFGPVFEKRVRGEQIAPGKGLETLRAACRGAATVPVFALGGVDATNSASCIAAGAEGIAGIRLFGAATGTW